MRWRRRGRGVQRVLDRWIDDEDGTRSDAGRLLSPPRHLRGLSPMDVHDDDNDDDDDDGYRVLLRNTVHDVIVILFERQ